jgi:hypothetical protein
MGVELDVHEHMFAHGTDRRGRSILRTALGEESDWAVRNVNSAALCGTVLTFGTYAVRNVNGAR